MADPRNTDPAYGRGTRRSPANTWLVIAAVVVAVVLAFWLFTGGSFNRAAAPTGVSDGTTGTAGAPATTAPGTTEPAGTAPAAGSGTTTAPAN